MKELEEKRQSELQFDKPKANPLPSYLKEPRSDYTEDVLAGNKTTILRHEALYRKKQEEELKLFKTYEAEKRGLFLILLLLFFILFFHFF